MSASERHTIKPLGNVFHTVSSSMASAVGRGTSNKDLTVRTCFDGKAILWVRYYVTNDALETWFMTYDEAAEKYNSLP